MEPEALDALKMRLRRAYEYGRARHAARAAAPTIAIAVVGGLMSDRASTIAIGVALYLTAALFHWRGRHLGRGVFPGVVAGLIPFAAAHAARMYGHFCTAGGCISACVPACLTGGLIAGAIVAGIVRRWDRPRVSWASASTIAALTSALGCACVGFSSLLAVAAGLLVGAFPLVLRPARGGA
jgi:hypothetical protein